ncbi:uncharacterized protein LOC111697338 [Eurytemora carolleeae]|uniref:uncharacterized protein LOC111697338 n=1 Tax=Eurytemora carolleeae TaxID=1294199 RepID=UPI000C75602B|nr:uncharacterized protein LOC111697338 [Eurytemora carolleeae]|eukprot:XP_023323074.1 uncharacterized protein LOC111697338 [Eurytemora affinis]
MTTGEVSSSVPTTPNSRRTLMPRSPCGVKIFNPPPSPLRSKFQFQMEGPSFDNDMGGNGIQKSSTLLDPYQDIPSRIPSPTFSHKGSLKLSRPSTPTSPMFAKLFSNRYMDYQKEGAEHSTSPSSLLDERFSSRPSSRSSMNHHLSPFISPCHSPAIREFRKNASPSMINLKSPSSSSRNSRILSPASSSPFSATSSSMLSPDSREVMEIFLYQGLSIVDREEINKGSTIKD